MRNPLGYKVLRTCQQGEEIYSLAKDFTAKYLSSTADSRLIGHINDSARSVPRNIAEGYGRNNTKQYCEFLGFSFGSLLELLEDFSELEKDIKTQKRKTKDDKGALKDLSRLIKLCMGEKTMLRTQMDQMGKMAGEQGLVNQNQKIAQELIERRQKEQQFDDWLKKFISK